MENAVFASHLVKVLSRFAVFKIYPFLRAVECHHGSIALKLHVGIFGKVGQSLHAVGIAQGKNGQPFSGLTFLSGMNAIFQAGIHQAGHTTVRNDFLGHLLLFAQKLTAFPLDERIVVGRNLTEIERELALLPVGPPAVDHSFQQFGIVAIAWHIVLTLIPDGAAQGITD